jgi:hypothetical protein
MEPNKKEYILALDVSSTTIGISIFEDLGSKGVIKLLHHVSPKVKPKPKTKLEELFLKVELFEKEFLLNYKDFGITKVIIEEPLLQSNNIYTVATLLKFNGIISKSIYDVLGIVPDFISSYDARKYAFPELMGVRIAKKDGTPLTEKQIAKNTPVLFGGYPFNVDKKYVIFEKVCDLEPQIMWFYDKYNKLKKENFDMTDSYAVGLAFFNMRNLKLIN